MIGFLIWDFLLCRYCWYRRYRFDIDSWSILLQLLNMLNKNDLIFCRYHIDIYSWSVFSFVISLCVDIDDIVSIYINDRLPYNLWTCLIRVTFGIVLNSYFWIFSPNFNVMNGSSVMLKRSYFILMKLICKSKMACSRFSSVSKDKFDSLQQ
jgi:hypothetical protein